MRLSLFFFLHLVAFVILLIVHPHARAQDDGWAIIEKDKNFIYMSKNGEFIHGDRIVLSLNYKDCDTVYHLFTFLTTKGDANIYQFENQNIPIKVALGRLFLLKTWKLILCFFFQIVLIILELTQMLGMHIQHT